MSTSVSNSLFYHEDDYRQIELVPAENLHDLLRQAENIEDFGAEHSSGVGYTDMMIREEHAITLKDRGIKPFELDAVLAGLKAPRTDQVSTGIRPGEMPCERTVGYGENYHGIFYDYEEALVNSIWISGFEGFDAGNLLEVLHAAGVKWDLLLMDWNSLELIDLRRRAQLEKYLR